MTTLSAGNTAPSIIDDDQRKALQQGAVIIDVEVNGSTGERTISDASTYLQGDVLTNKNVSKSSVRWVATEAFSFRHRIKQQCKRLLSAYGVSYYGGATLLPLAALAAVEGGLKEIEADFNEEVADLELNLDRYVDQHKRKNPEIAHLIERYRETGAEFSRKFKFRKMPATSLDFADDNAADTVVAHMSEQLLEEIAANAADIFKRTWSQVEKVTAKTLRPVEALSKKLNGLSFMDDALVPIADAFTDELAEFPRSFPVTGEPIYRMARFVALAANIDTLKTFGKEPEDDDEEDTNQELAWPKLDDVLAGAQEEDILAPATEVENKEAQPESKVDAEITASKTTAPEPVLETVEVDHDDLAWGEF